MRRIQKRARRLLWGKLSKRSLHSGRKYVLDYGRDRTRVRRLLTVCGVRSPHSSLSLHSINSTEYVIRRVRDTRRPRRAGVPCNLYSEFTKFTTRPGHVTRRTSGKGKARRCLPCPMCDARGTRLIRHVNCDQESDANGETSKHQTRYSLLGPDRAVRRELSS